VSGSQVQPCEVGTRSVRCLLAAVSGSCPQAIAQVLCLVVGSLSPVPAMFLDERMHARVADLSKAFQTIAPDSFIEQIAIGDKRGSMTHVVSSDAAATYSRGRSWAALSVTRVFG